MCICLFMFASHLSGTRKGREGVHEAARDFCVALAFP